MTMTIRLVDTHCHIHEPSYPLPVDEVLRRAREHDVSKLVVVGTDAASSTLAIDFAAAHSEAIAAVGVHPHETKNGGLETVAALVSRAAAIGEVGLDYFYNLSVPSTQIEALERQLQIAVDAGLPVIFHVREAFEDFWPVFDNFPGIRGVLHSFTDSAINLDKALSRGLFIGVGGISLFTRDASQRELFRDLPLMSMLLETDSPFLTPPPYRGKVNEPALVRLIAEHHARIRRLSLEEVALQTSANAQKLFAL